MDALTMTKNELITVLQTTNFTHLSRNEQARLRDYLEQIATTLQDASEQRRFRRSKRSKPMMRV